MKKYKIYNILKIFLLVIFAFYCLTESNSIKISVSDALNRCLTIIIPSLYAMMIVSGIISRSGLASRFGIPFIFVFSNFAGYPVGIKILCDEYSKNNISKKDAEIFSGICYGAGSAFVFGCVSGQLYGNSSTGNLILLSGLLANTLSAVTVLIFYKKSGEKEIPKRNVTLNFGMISESVAIAGKNITDICFAVLAFAVTESFLKGTGIFYTLSNIFGISPDILSSVLDITAVNRLPVNDYTLLPFLSALVSFGGLCVIFQLTAITSGKISLIPILLIRLFTSLASFIICRLLMPFFISGESIAVSAVKIYKSPSPVPSVLLIIMTVSVFCEYEKLKGRSDKPSSE